MDTVEEFIERYEGNQKVILQYLHELLTIEFGLTDKIRFKIPFYYGKTWICYLNPVKNNKVELAFVRGNEISNPYGILNFKNRKQVSGIEIDNINKIPLQELEETLHEAIFLDETTPYTFKKKKK